MNQRTLNGIASIGLIAAMALTLSIAVLMSGQLSPASALPPRYTPTPIPPRLRQKS
jgi:hypothetical protein